MLSTPQQTPYAAAGTPPAWASNPLYGAPGAPYSLQPNPTAGGTRASDQLSGAHAAGTPCPLDTLPCDLLPFLDTADATMADPSSAVPSKLQGTLDAQQHGAFDEYVPAIMLFAEAQISTLHLKRALETQQLLRAVQNKFFKQHGRAHAVWRGLAGADEISQEADAANTGGFPSCTVQYATLQAAAGPAIGCMGDEQWMRQVSHDLAHTVPHPDTEEPVATQTWHCAVCGPDPFLGQA